MFFTSSLFFVGLYILVKGANTLIAGASSFARRLRVSPIVIGLLITGIGTSIPEFSITVLANFIGQSDIGIGAIVGSNTFNILFILGISALLFPLKFKKEWIYRDFIWNIFAVIIVIMLSLNGVISRLDGLILISLFIVWLILISRHEEAPDGDEKPLPSLSVPLSVGMILAGIAGVLLGASFVVDGAVAIAKDIGVSEALIGLTIVGMSTSLPELTVSLVAAFRREPAIALGNIIGSNIFDFLGILGLGAIIKPIIFPSELIPDVFVTLLATFVLLLTMFLGKRYVLTRLQGFIFVLLFLSYLTYVFFRG